MNSEPSGTDRKLLDEISALKQRIRELEISEAAYREREGALQESELRYQTIFETTGTTMLIVEEDMTISLVNDGFENLTGYRREDVEGKRKWTEFVDKEDLERMVAQHGFRRSDSGRAARSYEFRLVHRDGHFRNILLTVDLIPGTKKSVASLMDITDRKTAERLLLESEEKYRLVVENAREAILVTQDFKLVFVNQTAVDIMGYPMDVLTSRPMTDFIHPGDRDMVLETHIKRLRGEDVPRVYAYRVICCDGSVKWAETNSIVVVWQGKPAVLNFLSDITERKATEDALRSSEQFLRLITDNIQDAIRVVDLQSLKFTYANPYCQKIFGIAAENYIASVVGSNLDTDQKDYLFRVLQDELEHDRQADPNRHRLFELRERNLLTGEIIWTENKSSFIRDADGRPTAVLSITRDISEQKRMEAERERLEERIRRAEKMEAVGTLAGGVAHDLNNVLGVLVGYSELLLEKIPEGSPLRKYVNNILQSGLRGAAIIQDLLTLARRGAAVSEVVDLNQVVTNYLRTPEFESVKTYHPHVTFRTELAEELLNIKGSPVHLGKTVMNLVSNAAEAISGQGEVTIRTGNRYLDRTIQGFDQMEEGDYVVLTVADSGKGISQEDIGKIFEPFYTKKIMGRSGTGLGLTVVWGTVKDHNGYIDVRSEEGRGTLFTLYFPVTREEAAAAGAPLSPEIYKGRGESVLIVDDVKEQRELALSILERLGYAASAVASGEAAIEYLRAHDVDLMVLDMIMDPGMDGLDTYRKVLESRPHQKAIIVSGFSESDRVRAAQALGAGAYVRKPYVIEKLGVAIRKELDTVAKSSHKNVP